MNPKSFDHIENKIREAAESFEPSFDDASWDKMEALLDKQDKDRRRPFAWLWLSLSLLLLIGGTTYWVFNKKSVQQNVQQSIAQNEQKNTAPIVKNNVSVSAVIDQPLTDNKELSNKAETEQQQSIKSVKSISIHQKQKITINTNSPVATEEENSANNKMVITQEQINTLEEKDSKPVLTPGSVDVANITDVKTENLIEAPKDEMAATSKDSSKPKVSEKKNEKNDEVKTSKFYFIASGGIDAASVDFLSFDNSKLAGRFGVGIGYQLTRKLSVQTGFYAGHKKYIAGPDDYTAKEGTYLGRVDINKVDANCLVYDVPISIRYNFFQKQKNSFYAIAGVSSFIMKEEDYYYYYTYNNTDYENGWKYTGNQNLFSVLNFSAGFERKLSSAFSLLAEPYISIPLGGVGEGSVKLYSAGLQFGIKYQPVKSVYPKTVITPPY